MENKNLKTMLQTALLASLEAGEEIMRIYTDPKQDFGIERKADNSPSCAIWPLPPSRC